MAGYYELKTSTNGQFFFNLKAANNETIVSSEQYKSKDSAKNGIAAVQKNCADGKNFDKKTARDGSFYFSLRSKDNGQILGRSEMYKSPAAMEKGVKSVMTNGPTTTIKEA
jgi:uncharacterized protein YegP (UPF0339 family)